MSGEFWLGFAIGIAAIFFTALAMPIDTVGKVAERGFFTWEDRLYVVTPASTPQPNADEGGGK